MNLEDRNQLPHTQSNNHKMKTPFYHLYCFLKVPSSAGCHRVYAKLHLNAHPLSSAWDHHIIHLSSWSPALPTRSSNDGSVRTARVSALDIGEAFPATGRARRAPGQEALLAMMLWFKLLCSVRCLPARVPGARCTFHDDESSHARSLVVG